MSLFQLFMPDPFANFQHFVDKNISMKIKIKGL